MDAQSQGFLSTEFFFSHLLKESLTPNLKAEFQIFLDIAILFLSYHRKYGRVQTGPVHRGSAAGAHAVAAQENQGKSDLAEHH